jgi:general secretion pathway protein G
MRKRGTRSVPHGMTLIEIMVVIAILGMMAAAIGISVLHQLNTAKVKKARLDCHQLSDALDLYFGRSGKYPDPAAGLLPLVESHIIKRLEKDPWGNDYVYQLKKDGPLILSYGADGQPGGSELDADISSAESNE